MQTRRLDKTGIELGSIGLGAMSLSIEGRPSEAEAIEVVLAAIDAGVSLIDTADVYCLDDGDIGHNERLIAKALRKRTSARVLVATKGGLERPGGDWVTNGEPKHLRRACERSLRALGVEAIDLYQLHAPDDEVPFADSVGTLADLAREGKIRHVGLSNVDVGQIKEAQSIVPIASVQNRCNLVDTASFESGVVDYCEKGAIAFLAYSPVGGRRGRARLRDHAELAALGRRLGASPYEIALAYLLASAEVMIPIPGASRVSSITSSARAADLVLSPGDLARLRELFPAAKRAQP